MLLRVLSYVYPGIHKSGVAIVSVVDERVKDVAVGSVENEILAPLLDKVRPTEMVVAVNKIHRSQHAKVPVPSSVTKFTIAKPGWEKSRIPLILDGTKQHGMYVHNVYKMMFRDLLVRGVSIRNWNIHRFTREWVISNAPRGLSSGK